MITNLGFIFKEYESNHSILDRKNSLLSLSMKPRLFIITLGGLYAQFTIFRVDAIYRGAEMRSNEINTFFKSILMN